MSFDFIALSIRCMMRSLSPCCVLCYWFFYVSVTSCAFAFVYCWRLSIPSIIPISSMNLSKFNPYISVDNNVRLCLQRLYILPSGNFLIDPMAIVSASLMKFSIRDFFSKCEQIRRNLRIWSHLLKKSSMENFIFCAFPPQ